MSSEQIEWVGAPRLEIYDGGAEVEGWDVEEVNWGGCLSCIKGSQATATHGAALGITLGMVTQGRV